MKKYLKVPILVIILTNLIPLIGVIFLGWSVFNIIFLYWFEFFFMGFFIVSHYIKKGSSAYPFITGGLIGFMVFHIMANFIYFAFLIVLFAPKHILSNSSEIYLVILNMKNIFVYGLYSVWPAAVSIILGNVYSSLHDKKYEKISAHNYIGKLLFLHIGMMFIGGLVSRIPYFQIQDLVLVLLVLFKMNLQINTYNKMQIVKNT